MDSMSTSCRVSVTASMLERIADRKSTSDLRPRTSDRRPTEDALSDLFLFSVCSFVYSDKVISSNASIRSLFLDGPAGRLEALLNAGTDNATHAALVCHPHPLFGGTLHNKVVFHTMKALNSFGFPVLRFNFRGTGLSQGEHDRVIGEVEDVRTALDWLDAEYHLPLVFAGFSFGSAVGLRAACADRRIRAVIGVGTPVVPIAEASEEPRVYSLDFLQDCI